MSVEMQTYVPDIDDTAIPLWVERLNSLSMHCEICPSFSFNGHTGFLPFRVTLERSAHEQLVGTYYLTGFEFYMDDFDLAKELESITPKPTFFEKITSKKKESTYFSTPDMDQRLASCTKVLRFVWSSADALELRMATLSSAVLAEITDGVCSYPADNIWYPKDGTVENALKDAEAYEASLRPKQLKLHKFEKWL